MTREEQSRWLKSFLITFIVFAIFSGYLYLRRGYYNLYIINKVLGSVAVVIAGLTLLIGPLRNHQFFSGMVSYRRQLGLFAFGLAVAHVIVSLLQQQRFPFPNWYLTEWLPVTFGIVVILVWAYMTYISRNSKIKELGVEVWKKRLSLAGWLGFIAIFLHIVVMKYEGWLKWFHGQVKATPELANPNYPPASLFVLLVLVSVILFRVLHYFFRKVTKPTILS